MLTTSGNGSNQMDRWREMLGIRMKIVKDL